MKRRILAVEQSYLIQDIILKSFKSAETPTEVIPCRTAREAMKRLAEGDDGKHPDLIILSTELPDTNGYMLARLIKENTSTGHIPIIMISSKDSEVDIDRAFECGVNDYIVKGPDMRNLTTKVRTLFENYDRKAEELILVVDDSVLTLNIIKFALEQRGFKVNTALEGETALQRALLLGPALILADLVMPQMDGFMLFKELKREEATKDKNVLVLSSRENVGDTFRRFGADSFLTKPVDPKLLLEQIKKITG